MKPSASKQYNITYLPVATKVVTLVIDAMKKPALAPVLFIGGFLAFPVGSLPGSEPGQGKGSRDAAGDPLPPGALCRLGTTRFRHALGNTHVAFTAGGRRLLSVSGGDICFWNAATGKEIPPPAPLPGSVFSAALSPDGGTLALGGSDGDVCLCDRATGRTIRRLKGPGGVGMAVAYSPDGKHLAAGGRFGPDLFVWDAATGALLHQLPTSDAELLVFSPDSKFLVTRADRTRLRLHDLGTGEIALEIRQTQDLLCWDFSPDGRTLATGTERGEVVLWETATGREKGRLAQLVAKQALATNPFGPRTTGKQTPYRPARAGHRLFTGW
jgi:WD40 repeat protein